MQGLFGFTDESFDLFPSFSEGLEELLCKLLEELEFMLSPSDAIPDFSSSPLLEALGELRSAGSVS